MRAEEVYRQVVVALARAGIAAPCITELSDTRDYTKSEAEMIANEAVDFIEAKIKHGMSGRNSA